jgi:hypothetical protein
MKNFGSAIRSTSLDAGLSPLYSLSANQPPIEGTEVKATLLALAMLLALPAVAAASDGDRYGGDYGEYKTICHEGQTLRVSYYEANRHIWHGDTWGECKPSAPHNPCPYEKPPVVTPPAQPGPVGPPGPAGPQGPAGPAGPPAVVSPPVTVSQPPTATIGPRPKCNYRIRLITPKARHGVRPFGGRIIGTRGRIVQTTMVAVAISPGRSPLNGRAKAYPIRWRGGVGHVWLYDETIWRHRLAWGQYRLHFKFRIRTPASAGGGTCVETRTVRWFNYDPGGLPS